MQDRFRCTATSISPRKNLHVYHGISSKNQIKIQRVNSFSTLLILSCSTGQILDTGMVRSTSFNSYVYNPTKKLGHTIVPGTIPIGTLLYHGSAKKGEIPRTPEWTAIDPEHSYFFCVGTPEDPGCWLLTLVATRPLRVLYFDGSSAAKFHAGGSMDSQDVLVWGEVRRKWLFEEDKRLGDLCKWGEQYGIDGYVR